MNGAPEQFHLSDRQTLDYIVYELLRNTLAVPVADLDLLTVLQLYHSTIANKVKFLLNL